MMIGGIYTTNENGEIVHEFETVRDAANHFGLHHSTICYRVHRGFFFDGLKFHYRMRPTKRECKIKATRCEYKDDDVELDREKYKIVPYEVRFGRVSITRCPFKRYPQPLVGSGECMRCSSFKGRNKKTHEVACSSCYI